MDQRGSHLSRRQFLLVAGAAGMGAVGLGLLAGWGRLPFPVVLETPPRGRMPRLGLLMGGLNNPTENPFEHPFRQGLRDLGYVDSQNLVIEVRYAQTDEQQIAVLASELVQLPASVIATIGSRATNAVADATTTIPIVQIWGVGDLVGTRRVASFARPGGNVTGMTEIVEEIIGKLMELLKEAAPSVSRVAVLNPFPPRAPIAGQLEAASRRAAELLGIGVNFYTVLEPTDLDPTLETVTREDCDGLLIVNGSIFVLHRQRILDLAIEHRWPSISNSRQFAAGGGLLAYEGSFTSNTGRAAALVDKILKGANPADLPVERPATFDLVVNLKTAEALGITFPESIRLQVTEVIR